MKYKIVLLLFTMVLGSFAFAQQKEPKNIILDTDIGPDYDDVGAIAILYALADQGECRILATMASNKHSLAAPVLSVLNTYFKRPDVPIGVVRGEAVNLPSWQKWDSLIVARYPHKIKNNDEAADATMLYRKILAAQPDQSVTIVTIGFMTNMANLLQSKPDNISSLNGTALIRKKVKLLVSMAGCFNNEMGTFKEFNIKKDSLSSKIAFNNWPSPIILSGFEIGAKIHTGLQIATDQSIVGSPVKDVFQKSIPLDANDAQGRMSWDETAVLVAVRGYEKYFDVIKGKMICNTDGSNLWDKNGTKDYYLVQKMPVPEIEAVLNKLIMHQPKTEK